MLPSRQPSNKYQLISRSVLSTSQILSSFTGIAIDFMRSIFPPGFFNNIYVLGSMSSFGSSEASVNSPSAYNPAIKNNPVLNVEASLSLEDVFGESGLPNPMTLPRNPAFHLNRDYLRALFWDEDAGRKIMADYRRHRVELTMTMRLESRAQALDVQGLLYNTLRFNSFSTSIKDTFLLSFPLL